MAFHYEKNLPHQLAAVNSIAKVFDGIDFTEKNFFSNPQIVFSDQIRHNINNIQDNHQIMDKSGKVELPLLLDIKMETGTGKTYTYVNMMFKLNQLFGINKFIICVPTLPIKAGTEKFLKSQGARLHFKESDMYPNKELKTYVVESVKSKKGKRDFIPQSIFDFVRADKTDKKSIHVLLINTGMINSSTLEKSYDTNLIENYTNPIEAIKATNPFVIIDEPHKFGFENKTYNNLLRFEPQVIIRYGATFPEKNKKPQYENLLYNLTSLKAFNRDLIKGIDVHIPNYEQGEHAKVVLTDITDNNAIFKYVKDGEKKFVLGKDDSLAVIDQSMIGLSINKLTRTYVELSNGMELKKRDSFNPNSYSETFQSLMIDRAIEEHFKLEKDYFQRKVKIKPIALFFIDYIESYRSEKDKSEEHIRIMFEEKLKNKITNILTDNITEEYREYLECSLGNINNTHGGYFSKDNTETDEKIIMEVEEILRDKEKLLSYKINDKWNVRRFIFSKWTLKEGWDNPNVFTICKLRTSGSEISKLQEVGRGLRLPVNEFLSRLEIGIDNFRLNYIVDFTEKDFADKLIKEIKETSEVNEYEYLGEALLIKQAQFLGKTADELFDELYRDNVIDRNKKIVDHIKFNDVFKDFIDTEQLKDSKVKVADQKGIKIKVRESNYEKFKELWENLNSKVMLNYKITDESVIEEIIYNFIKEKHNELNIDSLTYTKFAINTHSLISETLSSEYSFKDKDIKYSEFLKIISQGTNVPYQTINNAFVKLYNQDNIDINQYMTKKSARNIIRIINQEIYNTVITSVEYNKINREIHPTALTDSSGNLKEVLAADLGLKKTLGAAQEKYLYEEKRYDSPLELENIQEDIEEVVVFGKIPRRSIRIPMPDGTTYSPDFAYLVKRNDESKTLHLVIETKDVKDKENLRNTEINKIKIAGEKFFEALKKENHDFELKFETQYTGQTIKKIISEIHNY